MRGLALSAVTSVNGACYSYVARASTAPQPGEKLALTVTDQGRVNLGDRLGAGVERVDGTLVGIEGDQYVMSVSEVRTINHQTSHWSGERVNVGKSDVAILQERQFSRGRTAAAIGGAAVVLGVLAGTNVFNNIGGIFGGGPNPEPPPQGSLRPTVRRP